MSLHQLLCVAKTNTHLAFWLMQEIYETPLALTPATRTSPSQSCVAGAVSIAAVSSHPPPGSAANHKLRMRWTPELHERFVKSVTELEGPESES